MMGIKLKTAGDAVDYLRELAWKSIEMCKGGRAERLHFCADLIAKMGQDLEDATELADKAADLLVGDADFAVRMSALQAAREAAFVALEVNDRAVSAGIVYEAITDLIDELIDEQYGDGCDEAHKTEDDCGCAMCQRMGASAPQEADQGPSQGSRLPTQPEERDGPVEAPGEPLADFMMAMQDAVDAYADHLTSVEIVGAIEMVKDEALEVTRLGKAEVYFGRF